jgi:L-iditol 2-dehydrogenase
MSQPASTSMMAQVLHAVGDMRYEAIPRRQPGRGEVLVRIAFCGVCGSDIPRTFVKGTYHFPTVIGHEFSGTVEACGPDVEDLTAGDPVVVFPLIWCGRCPACEQAKYVQCLDYDYLGSRSDGAMAEFVVAPRQNLVRLPEGVSLAVAAMTEPAAVALHAVRRGGGLVGQTATVFGAGPIGLMVAQWARAVGAAQVILFDIIPEKLQMAQELGFSLVFDSRVVDPVGTVESLTGGEGAHLSIEGAGVPQTCRQALASARRGGRVVLLGNPSAEVNLPADLISQLMRREVNIYGTWNSDYSAAGNDDDWQTVLQGMASGTIELEPLVTHRIPLSRAYEALLMMKEQREFYSKVLIYPERGEAK